MAEEEEAEDLSNLEALLAADSEDVQASKGHNCKICIKQPRKNQLLLHCCKCYDTYFKTCPALLAKEIKDYDNLFRTWLKNKQNWDCLECRKKLPRIYCTVCHMDKDKVLLECAWCKNKCHSDCAGNVKLGLSISSIDWLCKFCNKGDKCANWSVDSADKLNESKALVGVKELEHKLKEEFYPYEGVKILQLNIAAQRLHKIKHFLLRNEKYVDVFAIGETNLNKNHTSDEYEINGYELIRADKKIPLISNKIKAASAAAAKHDPFELNPPPNSTGHSHKNGGLIIYVRKDWKVLSKSTDYFETSSSISNSNANNNKNTSSSSANESIYDTIEYLEVRIEKENKRLKGDSLILCLVLVYSPKPNNKLFLEKIEELLTQRIGKLKGINQIFVMGDVKINLLSSLNNNNNNNNADSNSVESQVINSGSGAGAAGASRLGSNFKAIMTELNYTLLLDEAEPTVATKKTAKLNHIMYASEDVEELGVRGGIVYLDWSSHYLVYAVKKYYFNQMPTLEAKTLKAFGFTNLSEHTTTRKERIMKAILDYAKAEREKLGLETEAAMKAKNGGSAPNGVGNGIGKNGQIRPNNSNGTENGSETNNNEDNSGGDNNNIEEILQELEKKNSMTKNDDNGKNLKPKRKKRFRFLPIWCSSIPETL